MSRQPSPPTSLPMSLSYRRSTRWGSASFSAFQPYRPKGKVFVIFGKCGLCIELSTRYPCSEIINSDKMQLYRGLDITANNTPLHQRNLVAQHLLGDVAPSHGQFECKDRMRKGTYEEAVKRQIGKIKIPKPRGGTYGGSKPRRRLGRR